MACVDALPSTLRSMRRCRTGCRMRRRRGEGSEGCRAFARVARFGRYGEGGVTRRESFEGGGGRRKKRRRRKGREEETDAGEGRRGESRAGPPSLSEPGAERVSTRKESQKHEASPITASRSSPRSFWLRSLLPSPTTLLHEKTSRTVDSSHPHTCTL